MATINIPRNCIFCKKVFYSRHKNVTHCSIDCYAAKKRQTGLRERLYRSIQKTDYCWLWTGSINHNGYGRLAIGGKSFLAHRLVYQLETGEDISGKVVRHFVCDNPPCCNPAHLKSGSMYDNAQDMVNRSRHAHGETSYAKLTAIQVLAIREDQRAKQEIADDYKVARKTISHIKNKSTWKHL